MFSTFQNMGKGVSAEELEEVWAAGLAEEAQDLMALVDQVVELVQLVPQDFAVEKTPKVKIFEIDLKAT